MKLFELLGHKHLKHFAIRPRQAHPVTKAVIVKKPKKVRVPIKPPKERKQRQRIHF